MPSTDYVPKSMRDKLAIQRATSVTRNAAGEEVPTWTTICELAANTKYSEGGESTSSNKETAFKIVTFETRKPHGLDINTKDRISFNGYFFDIISVNPLGTNHYLSIRTEFRS